MSKILIIEDEPTTMALIKRCLQSLGHRIIEARDGTEGLRLAMAEQPDAIVLDIDLPYLNGFEVCDALRNADFHGGILMLTARQSMHDKVNGLNRGADDYLCKPFDVRELLARVSALLRRHARSSRSTKRCTIRDIEIDLEHKHANKAGKALSLTRTEWSLLTLLIQHEGKLVSRDKMLDVVWGYDNFPSTRAIDTHVWRLRKKLSGDDESDPLIENVHGEGYRLNSHSGED